MAPFLSILIPTVDEADALPAVLDAIGEEPDVEVIVSDGGSRDATVAIARERGARVVEGEAGRGRQMNAAAAEARGQYLLFLHADTRPPPAYGRRILSVLAEERNAAGAFRLGIDGPGFSLRVVERFANLRAMTLRLPYGDQGLFLRAETFRQLGGFPEEPIMEEFLLVRRLRRLGRIVIVPDAVRTSARRWQRLGPWRTTFLNQWIVLCYYLGFSTATLARWYQAGGVGRAGADEGAESGKNPLPLSRE